ncbi:MAG: MFS transporter [Gemmataceae bacterium]
MSQHAAPTVSSSSSRLLPSSQRWGVDTFRALRHRNYRLYFGGQFVSVTGSWAQSAALMWLAYDLTKESTWPALVGAMQLLPTCVLGVWGGSLADRWPKRSLIFLSQASLLLLALLLGILVLMGHITPWELLAVATAAGIVNAIDLPARLAFVIDLVGRDDLPNAIALNSMLFNLARMVGPIVSGILFWLAGGGETGQTAAGVCFLLNGLSFVAVLAALAWMELPPRSEPEALAAGWTKTPDSLWEGFRYLGQHPRLILLLLLSGFMALFGWPILSLLPAVADQRLRGSSDAYAWMLSAIGGGAGLASLLVASFNESWRRRWLLAFGVGLSSSSLLGLALARSLPSAVGCCAVLGCGLILFFPTSQAIMQLRSADHVRGRVMGIWSMVLSGAHPLGHLLAGRAADRWLNGGSLDGVVGPWLAVLPGERCGLPLVLVLMGLGIAAASAIVLALFFAHHFASKPRLRR